MSSDDDDDDKRDDADADADADEPAPKPTKKRALKKPREHGALTFAKKHLTAIALVVVAAGLSAYVLYDRDSVSTGEAEARKFQLLPAWRSDDITKVQISFDDQTYEITRAETKETAQPWSLTENGVTVPAEEQVVDQLLTVFQYARIVRKLDESAVDRPRMGLTGKLATFAFTMGALSYTVRVGGTASNENEVYAEVETAGQPTTNVFVIASSTAISMKMPASNLRSRAFVPYLSTQLRGLNLEGEGGSRKFARAPWNGGRGSGFRFANGSEGRVGSRVDGGRLDQVLLSLGKMQAEGFLDEATARKVSKPIVTMTLVPKEGIDGVLVVGGACPDKEGQVVVIREKPTFLAACVPEGIVGALLRPATDFEDDGIMGAVVDEVTELSIQQGDKTLEIARLGTGFKVRRPVERDIEADIGNELLRDIENARGRLVDGAAELAAPITTVRVTSQSGVPEKGVLPTRVEEIKVGAPTNGEVIVHRMEDGQKLALDANIAAILEPSDVLLRDPEVVSVSSMWLEELVIERGEKRQVLKRNGGGFSLVEPAGKGLSADEPFALEAFNTLANLRATRWIAAEPNASHGLDKPRVVIKAVLNEGGGSSRKIELLLGARTEDGVFASATGTNAAVAGGPDGGVFLMAFERANVFGRNFISRESFRIQTDTVDQLDIVFGGATLTLTRSGRLLKLKDGTDLRAEELNRTISELAAARSIAKGSDGKRFGFDKPALEIIVSPRKGSATDGESGRYRVQFGGTDSLEGIGVVYARRTDVDATFAISELAFQRLVSIVKGEALEE